MSMTNEAYWIAAQTDVVPLAIGMPGTGKTQSIYAFSRALGRHCYVLIGSLRDPADIGGYPQLVHATIDGITRHYMELCPPKYVLDFQDRKRGNVLFAEELTTCSPANQAAMLRIMAERMVGDEKLPDDTLVLAACNPPEQAANGCELEAPMANRLYHHKWDMDWDAWRSGMLSGGRFPEPKFPVLPEDWRKNLGQFGGLIAAFQRHKPGSFAAFPKDRSQTSGPWPSPRSWTNACTLLAAAESVHADKGIGHTLVAGCVGDGAATEFSKWRENLDLPDPREMLDKCLAYLKTKKGKFSYKHPDRPDKVIALLSGVNHCAITDGTPDSWMAAMYITEQACDYELDVALACAGNLARSIPQGASFTKEFCGNLFPRIKQALIA